MKTIHEARQERCLLTTEYYKDRCSGNYDEYSKKLDEIMFCQTITGATKQQCISVLNKIKKQFDGEVWDINITPVISKSRRDIYVTTSDNLKFKEIYLTYIY
jgi:hypothetical protein